MNTFSDLDVRDTSVDVKRIIHITCQCFLVQNCFVWENPLNFLIYMFFRNSVLHLKPIDPADFPRICSIPPKIFQKIPKYFTRMCPSTKKGCSEIKFSYNLE